MSLDPYQNALSVRIQDFWLPLTLYDAHVPYWSHGPSIFPEFDFNLPSPLPMTHVPLTNDTPTPSHPSASPLNGMDIFATYFKETGRKIELLSFIATGDMLYPQNMEMQEKLEALGEAVRADVVIVSPDATALIRASDLNRYIQPLYRNKVFTMFMR